MRDYQVASACIAKLQVIVILSEITFGLNCLVFMSTDEVSELLRHFHWARLLTNLYLGALIVSKRTLPRLTPNSLVLSAIFATTYLLLLVYFDKLTCSDVTTWLYLTGVFPFLDLFKAAMTFVLLKRIIDRKK